MSDHGRNGTTAGTPDRSGTRLDRRALLRAGAGGAAGFAAASLVGGRGGASRAGAAQGGCSGDEVELSYAFWNAEQQPAIEQQIEAFREQFPNISVTPQVVPFADYFTKLQTGIAGGETYDVFWMNGPNLRSYASQGALADLQGLVGNGFDPAAFPQQLVDLYTHEGKLYGVSRDLDTIGLYYNKELFDAAEIAYPTPEWTWQDLRTAAEGLTKDGVWGFCATLSDQQTLFNFIYQNGGEILSADQTRAMVGEPAACEAITFLGGMVRDGLSPSVADQQANNPYQTLFPAGRVAMIPGGSWHAARLSQANPNIAVAPLPRNKRQATVIHGLGNAVWAKSPRLCEATEFVKFLGSQPAQQILAESGQVIPAMNGLQEAWKGTIEGIDGQVFLDAVGYSVPMPSSPKGAAWQAAFQDVIVRSWSGDLPDDQVCAAAAEAVQAAL